MSLKKIVLLFLLFSISVYAVDKQQSAYLMGSYLTKEEVESKLKSVGLEVLGSANVNESKEHQVIFYSSPELLDAAVKPKRGFAGALRVLVNSDKKQIVVANPSYFLRAFLQKDFKVELATQLEDKLNQAFGKLKGNDDKLEESDLAGYHFMIAMPYYEDFEEVGEGKQVDMIQRLERRAKDNIVFKKQIGDKFLYAVILPSKIESFVDKLEVKDKALLLPYMVVIDKEEARIMHAKYYLALSLPKLSMGPFMTISDIPRRIEESFEDYFKDEDED